MLGICAPLPHSRGLQIRMALSQALRDLPLVMDFGRQYERSTGSQVTEDLKIW